jgi:sugar O-acyltransferase (sialic acid O-acetyltransferase NeuD family)
VKPIVIFGVGDFARVACDYLVHDSPYEVSAFTVHERFIETSEIGDVPVVPFEQLESSHPPADSAMFVAVGFSRTNKARADMYRACKERGYELISYVSSRAICLRDVPMGDNCFVFEANVLQPYVEIGNNVILWSGNHIGHHTTIGDHVFVASHAVISGNCVVGESSFIGVNATLRDGVNVAPDCVIGAGAMVMRDTDRGDVLAVRGTDPIEKKSWELNF